MGSLDRWQEEMLGGVKPLPDVDGKKTSLRPPPLRHLVGEGPSSEHQAMRRVRGADRTSSTTGAAGESQLLCDIMGMELGHSPGTAIQISGEATRRLEIWGVGGSPSPDASEEDSDFEDGKMGGGGASDESACPRASTSGQKAHSANAAGTGAQANPSRTGSQHAGSLLESPAITTARLLLGVQKGGGSAAGWSAASSLVLLSTRVLWLGGGHTDFL